MSVVGVGGRRFAAGLYWMERGSAVAVARNARAFGRPWYVHWGEQTGYAADEDDPVGCPSLAASLQAHISEPFWMALVEATDGRLALVRTRDGAFLADGDEVFPDRATALEAFERGRAVGWSLHATPGLVEGEIAEIDLSALADDAAMRLAAAPLARLTLPKVGRFLALAAVVASAGLGWTEREALWRLVAGPEPVETEQAPVEPPVAVALDAGALIAGCRQALMAHPPYLPAWRTERVSCEGRFGETPLTAVRPELEDRAVLTVRWRLETGRPAPLHRRIAEDVLAEWYAGSVTGVRAWAVAPLEPVLRLSDAAPPSLLAFREAVDRHLGIAGTGVEYPSQGADGIEVLIETRRPPSRLADAIASVPGLELLRLVWDAAGAWRLEGRRVSPIAIPRTRFHELTQSVAQRTAEPTAGPGVEPAVRPPAHDTVQPSTEVTTGSPDHG